MKERNSLFYIRKDYISYCRGKNNKRNKAKKKLITGDEQMTF